MSSDKNVQELASHLSTLDGGLDKAALLNFLKEKHPSLKDIKTLDERMTDFETYEHDVSQKMGLHIDFTKAATKMADTLAPVLFHKRFAQSLNNLLGFLNEKDLLVLFAALGKKNPAVAVKEYSRFMTIIKNKDKTALTKEFLLGSAKQDGTLNEIAFQSMIGTIQELVEEVLNCHCYYNGQDKTGSVGTNVSPKIRSYLSSELAHVRVSASYTFFNQFARKTFYIHGITKGLSTAGEINAAANQHKVEVLQRVKTHILRPLWWSTNLSSAKHDFVKGCRDTAHALVTGWYGFINSMKQGLNWLMDSSYFIISERNRDSVDFNDTTFDFTQQMNALTPLEIGQARQAECPVDVVTHVEDFVAKRTARPGFFGGTLGRQEDEPENEQLPAFKM